MNTSKEKEEPKLYKFGSFVLDPDGTLKRVRKGEPDKFLSLSPINFKVLTLLVCRAGKTLSKKEIMSGVWNHTNVEESSLTKSISEIRKCIEKDPKNPVYIRTVRSGDGYMFVDPDARPSSKERQFSKIDSIHVHVDGGDEAAPVAEVVRAFDREGKESKINKVVAFARGPQRDECPEDYEPHTPGGINSENLQYFSTHILGDFAETKRGLRQLLTRLPDTAGGGMVIEAERVIGKFSDEGGMDWSNTYIHDFPVLCSGDVGYEVSRTQPIEIHYAVDIPRQGAWADRPPLDLKALTELTTELGLRVGGWFLFDKGERNMWAYRSNMFNREAQGGEIEACRLRLKSALEELGRHQDFTCKVTALVEQAIGIWNTPLKRFDEPRSVEELSDWEAKYPNLRDFWVVTPNFLGDKDEHIQGAMVRNLQNRNVTYTYFLQSFADYNRLLSFAEELDGLLGRHGIVYDRIQVVLVHREASGQSALERVFRQQDRGSGCFIANPLPGPDGVDDIDGYVLEKSEHPGRISGGRLMRRDQVKEIVEMLKPLVPDGRRLQGFCMPLSAQKNREIHGATIICIDLRDIAGLLNDVGDSRKSRLLREYDLLVAGETSKLGGHVVRSIEPGYLLMFEGPNEALLCAEQILRGGAAPDNQRIAIDLGGVWRVMRAHGYDYYGKTVARCRRLLKKAPYGELLATDSFYHELNKCFRAKMVPFKEEVDLGRSISRVWKLVR
jgi:DNA-binding winged helix-turn-helix (wHTH) protein/class 3 adenylate cyclase